MSITGKQLAQAAIDALDKGITYQQEDCQAFVENSVKRAGGTVKDYMGSNDMLRNALTKMYELPAAIKGNLLQPGWLLFIVEPGHNSKYNDEMGDASHVGIFTGAPQAEVVHSSGSRGGVFPSTLKNAWTHAGPPVFASFDSEQNDNQGRGGKLVNKLFRVVMPEENAGQTVNLRKNADTGSVVLAKVRDGEEIMAGDEFQVIGQYWRPVTYNGISGYIMERYLQPVSSTDAPPYFPIVPEPQKQPLTVGAQIAALEHAMSIVLGENWRTR